MGEREFWVVYDYGMGGVWGLARASSEAEVVSTFPELEVVDKTPEWMTPEREENVRLESFVIGEPNSYPQWLHALIAERSNN